MPIAIIGSPPRFPVRERFSARVYERRTVPRRIRADLEPLTQALLRDLPSELLLPSLLGSIRLSILLLLSSTSAPDLLFIRDIMVMGYPKAEFTWPQPPPAPPPSPGPAMISCF